MIFVAAGTQDGRGLVEYLLGCGYEILASVVTDYGKLLLPKHPNLKINDKKLDKEEMKACLEEHEIQGIIDATHPYAVNVSRTAMEVAEELGIPYLRYEREVTPLPDYDKLHLVASYEEAAPLAMELGECIFLTTGSNRLELFAQWAKAKQKRIIARVLPADYSIEICKKAGITPRDIVAMQGPFSEGLNLELYKKYDSTVVVMKNSGTLGGTETKLTAAIKLNMDIVIIDRPAITYKKMVHSYREAEDFLQREKVK